MKKIYLAIIILFVTQTISAQNLVLNHSFENYTGGGGFTPPDFNSGDVTNWTPPSTGTADYLTAANNSGLFSFLGVPNNSFGNQSANTGTAYVGLIAYESGGEYREYVQGTLSQPLSSGDTVCVEFYVSLAENGTQRVDEIGLAFTSTMVNDTNSDALQLTPAITANATQLNDYTNWVLVSGSYIASGGEQYVIIGNFNTNANTTVSANTAPTTGIALTGIAYYYIEDVSVIKCSTVDSNTNNPIDSTNNPGDTTNPTPPDSNGNVQLDTFPPIVVPNIITPNEDGANDAFLITNLSYYSNTKILIYNRWGKLIYENTNYLNDWKGTTKSGEKIADGVYFYVLSNESWKEQIKGSITVKR